MYPSTLLAFGAGFYVLAIAIVTVSVLLIGLVLLQKNRGSGLSGAFGGVGGHTAFGTKTGDFLTWVTVGLAVTFLLMNIIAGFVFEPGPMPGMSGVAPVTDAGTGSPATPATDVPQGSATGSDTPAPPTGTAAPTGAANPPAAE